MSVLCTLANGWVLSHDHYIRTVYERVQGTPSRRFAFHSSLFQIITPFVRPLCINKDNLTSPARKRRKKRRNGIVNTEMKEAVNVKEYAVALIEEAQKLGHYCYVPTSNDQKSSNVAAQDKVQSFYHSYPVSPLLRLHGENNLNQGLITEVDGESYLVPAECKFFCYDVKEIEHKLDLLVHPYDLILLDPPWWNKYIRRKKAKCAGAGYQMMHSKDLANIPVATLTAPGSLVAVWCTNSISHLSCLQNEIFPAWGMNYVGQWFWLKVTHGGEPVCEFSEPPGKQPFERIVFGYKKGGNRKQPLPEPDRVIISVPSAIHSHKPPLSGAVVCVARHESTSQSVLHLGEHGVDILAPYLPTKPRCMEIFARYLLPGWTSWGCEVLKLQHLSLYKDRDHEN